MPPYSHSSSAAASSVDMISDRYEIVRTLGEGAFGRTFLARDVQAGRIQVTYDTNGSQYAIIPSY